MGDPQSGWSLYRDDEEKLTQMALARLRRNQRVHDAAPCGSVEVSRLHVHTETTPCTPRTRFSSATPPTSSV